MILKYSFEMIRQFENCCLFRDNMIEFMTERNYPREHVLEMAFTDAVRDKKILDLYHYVSTDPELLKTFYRYLSDMIRHWLEADKKNLGYLYEQLTKAKTPLREKELRDSIELTINSIAQYSGYCEDAETGDVI